jgi:hypothetical protein
VIVLILTFYSNFFIVSEERGESVAGEEKVKRLIEQEVGGKRWLIM